MPAPRKSTTAKKPVSDPSPTPKKKTPAPLNNMEKAIILTNDALNTLNLLMKFDAKMRAETDRPGMPFDDEDASLHTASASLVAYKQLVECALKHTNNIQSAAAASALGSDE